MSNESDFKVHEEAIKSIDPKSMKHPNMPVGINLQEAEDLYAWCGPDKIKLTAAGLDEAVLDGLPSKIGALRHIQSQWNSTRMTKEEAQKQFALLGPSAYDLCDELVHHMLFGYRKHPDLKSRVQAIADGTGDADMIQDLSDLAVHGKNNPEPLAEINFDMSLLDQAASQSDALSALLGSARGEKATDKEIKIMRDKAYTYLKESVDEIRQTGQYTFWRDKARKPGYASAHFRRTRSGSTKTTPDAP